MSVFILILFFHISSSKGGVTVIEFNSKKDCLVAGNLFIEKTQNHGEFICTPKGFQK